MTPWDIISKIHTRETRQMNMFVCLTNKLQGKETMRIRMREGKPKYQKRFKRYGNQLQCMNFIPILIQTNYFLKSIIILVLPDISILRNNFF